MNLTKVLALVIAASLSATQALAQSSPNLMSGQVPTAAQWNSYFAKKWDYPGYTALNKGGDVMLGLLRFSSGTPSLTSCGTSPSIRGNNQAGEVTMGTGSPTGCTITFNAANPFSAAPSCVVTWQTNLASMQYTITITALTLVQTATSSNKVNYYCPGLQ